jgi:hypothetical protein
MHEQSPIQAESKFSQAGPSPRKEFPRKRLGFEICHLDGQRCKLNDIS